MQLAGEFEASHIHGEYDRNHGENNLRKEIPVAFAKVAAPPESRRSTAHWTGE